MTKLYLCITHAKGEDRHVLARCSLVRRRSLKFIARQPGQAARYRYFTPARTSQICIQGFVYIRGVVLCDKLEVTAAECEHNISGLGKTKSTVDRVCRTSGVQAAMTLLRGQSSPPETFLLHIIITTVYLKQLALCSLKNTP